MTAPAQTSRAGPPPAPAIKWTPTSGFSAVNSTAILSATGTASPSAGRLPGWQRLRHGWIATPSRQAAARSQTGTPANRPPVAIRVGGGLTIDGLTSDSDRAIVCAHEFENPEFARRKCLGRWTGGTSPTLSAWRRQIREMADEASS